MSDLIPKEEIESVRREMVPILQAAQAMAVTDEGSFTQAIELGRECDERAKRVEATWGTAKRKAYEAYKTVLDTIASFTKPLKEAKDLLGKKAYAWKREEDARRRAEEERRQAEERKRIEEQRIVEAEALAAKGKQQEADSVLEAPVVVEAARPAPAAPKIAGTALRQNWQFEVIDEAAIPREYLTPDLVKIGRVVKAMKDGTRIPGIRVFDAGSVAFR